MFDVADQYFQFTVALIIQKGTHISPTCHRKILITFRLLKSVITLHNISPTYKESFQVRWDNSIPLFLHAAIYLEVFLFR
jgi:hypothetical protein